MKSVVVSALFLCCLLSIYQDCSAAKYYTRTAGTWGTAIWGTTTSGAGGLLPALNDGDTLYIDDDVTLNGNENTYSNTDIVFIISATFNFTANGQLRVGAGSKFILTSTGRITSPGGSSNKIVIGGGNAEWSGGNIDLTGPGSFDNDWTCCTLPVKLLSFNVNTNGNAVMLSWATSIEVNFSKFLIQRSVDGLDFEDIGEVEGKGFDIYNVVSEYTFVDPAPMNGFNYYRLKAIDLDDSFEYFGVKAVRIAAAKELAVYPNPSSGESVTFRTNFHAGESDHVTLVNQLGVEVFNGRARATDNTITFPNALRPGVYMLRYTSGDFEQIQRIIVKN